METGPVHDEAVRGLPGVTNAFGIHALLTLAVIGKARGIGTFTGLNPKQTIKENIAWIA